ncbi:hypothetical protein ACRYCC_26330 [Actinomadura scrupuli]|uniref:hypothetical protein n=1 Tax=Actinomadura scrupuli TaxID=559629 RepID=UPI003D97C332
MTTTTRYGLHLPAADGSDLVSVSTDLIGPLTTIDAELGVPITTALPSNPASGKTVAVSAAGPVFRSYFHNGTSPASAGWVELLNSSGTFGSDIKLASGQKLVIGSDVNLYRNAADVLRTDDSFVVSLNLTVAGSASIGGALTVTGDLKLTGGTTIYRSKLSSPVTVATSTTETVIATMTIPASDPVVGAVYTVTAWGIASVLAATTPTMTWRSRIGGVAGAALASSGARTASSGVTNHSWRVSTKVVCLSTGVSGTWFGQQVTTESLSVAGAAPWVAAVIQDGTAAQTKDTTAAQDLVITAQWSASNAANTLTCQGVEVKRVA